MNSKDRFVDILLDGILPSGFRLVTDKKYCSLLLLKGPVFHEQMRFTPKEYAILVLLLEAYPRGVRYERVLAESKDMGEEEALALLKDAMLVDGNDGFERVLRQARTLVSRLRINLMQLGIGIDNTRDDVYILTKIAKQHLSLHSRIRAEIAEEEAQDNRASS